MRTETTVSSYDMNVCNKDFNGKTKGFKKGHKGYWKNKRRDCLTKQKIRESLTNREFTKQHRRLISKAMKKIWQKLKQKNFA